MSKYKHLLPVANLLLGITGIIVGLLAHSESIFLFSGFAMLFIFLIYYCILFMKAAWKNGIFQKADQVLLVSATRKQKLTLYAAIALLILICIIPMGLSPYWNGKKPQHRDQYEVMAESILNGHLHLDLYVDPVLASLDNPYNLEARKESGAYYYWDHAFYNQKYYMYFGVVPVFLTFLPYRLITGAPLNTYHATQLYTALIILGIFVLFSLLIKLFFRYLSLGRYFALSAASSAISVWYAVSCPSLYCTAITSAIFLVIWSLYFFIRAVWVEPSENRQILCAFIGSFLGALAFGCRPPIALANLVVIPLLAVYLKRHRLSLRLFLKLVVAALPYFVVAALLMAYNALRFDNPFEFGQSYQLTVTDQTQYMHSLDQLDIGQALLSLLSNYFLPVVPPSFGGVFMNFPALLLVFGVFSTSVRNMLKRCCLHHFAYWLFIVPLLITAIDILWSPYLLERYRMDIYFLMTILSFLVICAYGSMETKNMRLFDICTYGLPFLSFFTSVILFLFPYDMNWTHYVLLAIHRRILPFI